MGRSHRLGLVLLLLPVTIHMVNGERTRRQAGLSCTSDQTKVISPKIIAEDMTCATVIGLPTNNNDPILRGECQRWLKLPEMPYDVKGSYVKSCDDTSGSAVYRVEICCEGTVSALHCFNCYNTTDDYSCNYDSGTIEICAAGEVCQMTESFYVNYPNTIRRETKGCAPQTECDVLVAENTDTCQHWIPAPSCTDCCTQPFCNYDSPDRTIYRADQPCVSNPCHNGGTCENLNGTHYLCHCSPGYTGTQCETRLCVLGDLVLDNTTTAGYYCDCWAGTYGDRCENTFCQQGYWASQSSPPYYYCRCLPKYAGINCSEDVPQCAEGTNFCENGGTCMDYDSYGLHCICPEGFIGATCEKGVRTCFDPNSEYFYYTGWAYIPSLNCSVYEELSYRPHYAYSYFMDICRSHMQRPSGPIFVNNEHGFVSSVEKYFLQSCERGTHYASVSRAICCPTCYSVPCENGGWCTQKSDDDYNCKCRYGYGGRNCESKVATCVITGDPHQHTFDGAGLHYQGRCLHVITNMTDSTAGLDTFEVTARNEGRGNNSRVSWLWNFEITVFGHVIRLDKNETLVDGVPVYPDYMGDGFAITMNGWFTRLQTNFSLAVEYDGEWVAVIKMPQNYKGLLGGICGNYNGNSTDDYVTSNGTDVTDRPERDTDIGNSWIVPDPLYPNCPPYNGTVECPEPLRSQVELLCAALADPAGPYSACLSDPSVSADTFHEDCVYDVCANYDSWPDIHELICSSAEALAIRCQNEGHVINWREELGCPKNCTGGTEYKRLTTACHATCENPDAPEECGLPDTENCVCPEEMVMHQGQCMNASDCGCVDEHGTRHEIGATWLTDDCTIMYNCTECESCGRKVGELVEMSYSCPSNQTCRNGHCSATETCECTVGTPLPDPKNGVEVIVFDFDLSGPSVELIEKETLVLVAWNPADDTSCKFKLMGLVSKRKGKLRLKFVKFKFGQHPTQAPKYARSLKIGLATAKEKGLNENGEKFTNDLDLIAAPYTFDNGDTQVTLTQSGNNFTMNSSTCSWGLVFRKNVPEPYNVVKFTVETGGNGQPQSGDLEGTCGNCDGVFDS